MNTLTDKACVMLHRLDDIKAATEQDGGSRFWFHSDTMRFWRTRCSETVFPTANGTFFVTSERDASGEPRMYSIRFCTLAGQVETIEFQTYRSRNGALGNARRRADEMNATKCL